MLFLVVVTPPYIYHGCSTQNTFWEEKFTGKEDLFLSMDMKNCGRLKVRKHKDIKGSDKSVTLDISSKFDILNNLKTTSSESICFGKIRKGVGYRSGFQDQSKVAKIQKERCVIRNVSKKDLSKTTKEFEKIGKLPYEKKRPKHEPTDRYFHLSRQLAKCMIRSDNVNWQSKACHWKCQ